MFNTLESRDMFAFGLTPPHSFFILILSFFLHLKSWYLRKYDHLIYANISVWKYHFLILFPTPFSIAAKTIVRVTAMAISIAVPKPNFPIKLNCPKMIG